MEKALKFAALAIAAYLLYQWWSQQMDTSQSGMISKWAQAIQTFEGWKPGSTSYRNNNPGNLRVTGDMGVDSNGFGVFSSYQAGWNALISDLSAKVRKYPTETLQQIMARYAPASDGNSPTNYASFIANRLGVSINDTLSSIFGGNNG